MRKILDICDTPDVKTYTYHAYLNAILQSNAKNGMELLSIFIENYNNKEWNFSSEKNQIKYDGKNVIFCRNNYSGKNEGYLLRKSNFASEDCITVKINNYHLSSLSSIVNIVFGKRNGNIIDDNAIRFGLLGNGNFFVVKGKFEICTKIRNVKTLHCWLKAKIIDTRIGFYFSYDKRKWKEVCVLDIPENDRVSPRYLGVNYNMYDNDYENWKFLNYFQIFYDKENSVKVDYYNVSKRDYRYHHTNQFLVFEYKDVASMNKIDLLNYLCNLIYHDIYFCLFADEYYFEESVAELHFMHSNLFFGVDESQKTFFALGYNNEGKLIKKKISFGNLYIAYQSVEKVEYKKVETIQYMPSRNKYNFEVKYLISLIEEFLKGENSSLRLAGMLPTIEGKYGIKVFDEMENDPNMLVGDLRICYLLLERSMLMKKRIRFLYDREYLILEQYEKLIRWNEQMAYAYKKLMYVCMLYKKSDQDYSKSIAEEIKKIKKNEQGFCTCLLNILNVEE